MARQENSLDRIVGSENLPTSSPSSYNNEGQIEGAIPATITGLNQGGIDEEIDDGSKQRSTRGGKRSMVMCEQPSHERMTKKVQRERSASLESDASTTQWEVEAKLRAKELYDCLHTFGLAPPCSARYNELVEMRREVNELKEKIATLVRIRNVLEGTTLQASVDLAVSSDTRTDANTQD